MPPRDAKSAHVRDIENTAAGARPEVFFPDRAVVERKLPAGVFDDFRLVLDMKTMERRSRQRGGFRHLRTVAVPRSLRHHRGPVPNIPIIRPVTTDRGLETGNSTPRSCIPPDRIRRSPLGMSRQENPPTRGEGLMSNKTTTTATARGDRDILFRLAMAAAGVGLLLSVLI